MTKELWEVAYDAYQIFFDEVTPPEERRRAATDATEIDAAVWQAVAEAVVESQRTELERLVEKWRESADAAETWPDPVSQGEAVGESKCADDLEAVLRKVEK